MSKVSSITKNIALITTGGTIGGTFDSSTGAIKATDNGKKLLFGLEKFSSSKELGISEIANISLANVVSLPPLLSEDMTPYDWKVIAEAVAQTINSGVDGVVVAHGTDTMAYTSAALSFMLGDLSVPVVLTGSHFPPDHKATDAFRNLYDGVVTAASELAGVFVVFNGSVHRGTKVRKIIFSALEDFNLSAEGREHNVIVPEHCFISVNMGKLGLSTSPLGYVKGGKIVFLEQGIPHRVAHQRVRLDTRLGLELGFEVSLLKVYPGFKPLFIRALIEKGMKGIILELYNSGTGCTRQDKYLEYSLVDSIKEAVKGGVFVFATSQQIGKVDMSVYDSSIKLYEAGAIPLKDMTTESAVVKLMWVLGHTQKREEVEKLMLTNVAGELYTPEG